MTAFRGIPDDIRTRLHPEGGCAVNAENWHPLTRMTNVEPSWLCCMCAFERRTRATAIPADLKESAEAVDSDEKEGALCELRYGVGVDHLGAVLLIALAVPEAERERGVQPSTYPQQ